MLELVNFPKLINELKNKQKDIKIKDNKKKKVCK